MGSELLGASGRGEWFSIVLSFVFGGGGGQHCVAVYGRRLGSNFEVHFVRAALKVSGASFMVVQTEHALWDRRKPCSNLIRSVGRSTFRTNTDFQPAVRRSNPRTVTATPSCCWYKVSHLFHSKCSEIPLDE